MDDNVYAPLPPASLIICSRNRPKLLSETITSILEGESVPAEIVIVDQSEKRDDVLANLQTDRACDLRYIWTHTVGLSRANNLGIAAACYDILVFTHDDVSVTSGWFGTLVGALLQTDPRSVVTGQVRLSEEAQSGGFQITLKVDQMGSVYMGRLMRDVLYPLNMAMYRTTIKDVGLFDERLGPGTPFPAAEDNDFGFRLLEAGYRIAYIPEAMLYHRAWRQQRDYVPLRWNYGVGRGGFYAKHLHLHDRYMLWRMVHDVRNHFIQSLHSFRRERQRAQGDAALAMGIVYGSLRWLTTRRWQH